MKFWIKRLWNPKGGECFTYVANHDIGGLKNGSGEKKRVFAKIKLTKKNKMEKKRQYKSVICWTVNCSE